MASSFKFFSFYSLPILQRSSGDNTLGIKLEEEVLVDLEKNAGDGRTRQPVVYGRAEQHDSDNSSHGDVDISFIISYLVASKISIYMLHTLFLVITSLLNTLLT